MKNIKTFNIFASQKILENINNSNYSENQIILEEIDMQRYQDLIKKTIKEISANFYFVGTFGTSLTVLIPVVENFIKNFSFSIDLTTQNIILLTIFAITVIAKESKEKIEKIASIIKEKGIDERIIDKIVNFIKNLWYIFLEITKILGKIILIFTDMLAYSALFVPFLHVTNSLIVNKSINYELLGQTLTSFELAIGSIGLKLFLNKIMNKLEFITGSNNKFQNKNNIKPLLVNDDLKSVKNI
jgi:hypothetical protein